MGSSIPPPTQGRNDRVEAKQRAAEINRLRIEGRTYAEIAERLGYADPSGVRRLAMAHATRVADETAAELRWIENERLDVCTRRLMETITDDDAPAGLVLRAIDAFIRVSARRAALNGLDGGASSGNIERVQQALNELSILVLGEPLQPAEDTA